MSENKQIVAAVGLLIISLFIFFKVTNTDNSEKTLDSTIEQAQSASKTNLPSSEKGTTESTTSTTKKQKNKETSQTTVTKQQDTEKTKTAESETTDTTEQVAEKKVASLLEQPEEQFKDLPKVSKNDWNLVLVGPNHKLKTEIPDSQLTTLANGFEVDKRIAKSFEELAAAAEKAGYPLVTISAFRSVAYQEEVFEEGVSQNMSRLGLSEEAAIKEAKKTMTEPGFSEHHTGLALDVVDESWNKNYVGGLLDARFGEQPGAKWLAEHAATYGFIIRYPKNQEKITAITYEPWHIRYVGKENAEYIEKNKLTLEEYLDRLP
ncbi:peptidase M15 [Enterococcus sp. JM4C]|uniref:M15 family metallopeptidase n=1 Tax=Candidatus Enterococcus huntleyi TaxID=1857217 RepID=UPI00137AE078|nr:M15 family metallopeptidase [Enterococcus sp. JM4C]KAF1297701.1 peptidase M15 [Enterococcus sp. JM4C]